MSNSYQLLLQYIKAGVDTDEKAPALEKIPTNQFIDNLVHSDADDDNESDEDDLEPAGEKKGHTISLSLADKRSSRQMTRIKAEPLPEEADDLETVIGFEEPEYRYDDTGQTAYKRACKKYDTLPCSSFHRQLGDVSRMDMRYYNVGKRGAKALAVPMLINSKITSLNLKGNDINAEGLEYICKMMSENVCITELDISDNNIRSHGAKVIAEMLKDNQQNLKTLNLSGSNFNDCDAPVICSAIEEHPHLKQLNLSHNNFGLASGPYLRRMISENNVLDELDLSWNQIRLQGAIDVAKGVKENVGLKILNLSWNGFGESGAKEMALALKTCTIKEMDLSSTRINSDGFLALIKGFKGNDDLQVLKLQRNPIPEESAKAALEFLLTLDSIPLEVLDLGECMYPPSFGDKVKEVQEKHPDFTCPYGYTDSYGKRKLKQYDVVAEALAAMNKYCEDNNINIVELFSRFDGDGSMSVSHDEFKQGLREAKIPLSDYQIEELIKNLDEDGDGEIDFGEMVMGAERCEEN